jgi:hypothetical protein
VQTLSRTRPPTRGEPSTTATASFSLSAIKWLTFAIAIRTLIVSTGVAALIVGTQ